MGLQIFFALAFESEGKCNMGGTFSDADIQPEKVKYLKEEQNVMMGMC